MSFNPLRIEGEWEECPLHILINKNIIAVTPKLVFLY